jgi:hypothetical protein
MKFNLTRLIIKFYYFCDMKFLCITFLLFFTSFLATPTIISMIDKDVDISCFYSVSEDEEEMVSFDEIKSITTSDHQMTYVLSKASSKLNVSLKPFLNFTNLAHQIFSPPPEFI